MHKNKSDKIKTDSWVPKYVQLANAIMEDLRLGKLKVGDRIPSINEMSFDLLLSRDTVEKAYKELRDQGILTSVRGKGYYITSFDQAEKTRVLLLFNKLSSYKKIIYYSIVDTLGKESMVDIQIHHYNRDLFQNLLTKNLSDYDYFVVAPHFFDDAGNPETAYDLMEKIPAEKLFIIDKPVKGHEKEFPGVFQDFSKDIFEALESGQEYLKKYKRLVLVFPKGLLYPFDIVNGFKKFCLLHEYNNVIVDGIDEEPVYEGDLYLVLAETDLANLVKKSRVQNLPLGEKVGIISYNDTPLKEILAEGITTVSTDFVKMGETIAKQILNKEYRAPVKNPFNLILRKSI